MLPLWSRCRASTARCPKTVKLTLKKYINIGVAVDTPNGLVVPVFKDVNKKSITELSRELMTISRSARRQADRERDAGRLLHHLQPGRHRTTHFAPIVNAPEVAILGVSKSAMEPVWNGKEFMPRLMMPMSLSFDHRVIDGADGAPSSPSSTTCCPTFAVW
ncbi:2-oxo acid dehydrogenase subunit E2 [Serratia ureilytica]